MRDHNASHFRMRNIFIQTSARQQHFVLSIHFLGHLKLFYLLITIHYDIF